MNKFEQQLNRCLSFVEAHGNTSDKLAALEVRQAVEDQPEPVGFMFRGDFVKLATTECCTDIYSVEAGHPEKGQTTVKLYTYQRPVTNIELGRHIYNMALSDRRGFRQDQMDIDADIWDEIFEAIGDAAQQPVQDSES